eukprot:CAMPEP_0181332132 /NCGR_PEP_ID=MMETSP1101-20121128/24910_1 /TAXON_ID=46948 /ORGANISM="Rhodomonas abbreviata, Strain Caron Lab Isolate" /LENGTH=55 /DNA_ID=CAMNT_0023441715 /DNA_START=108 /DNA_END=271 /DNA_ORIENTATION=+
MTSESLLNASAPGGSEYNESYRCPFLPYLILFPPAVPFFWTYRVTYDPVKQTLFV